MRWRRRRAGVWTAIVIAIATALGGWTQAHDVRWALNVQLAPLGLEVSATTDRARLELTF
jgi:uncharacterized membrane protein YhiD involved in acid resistance